MGPERWHLLSFRRIRVQFLDPSQVAHNHVYNHPPAPGDLTPLPASTCTHTHMEAGRGDGSGKLGKAW